MRDPRRNPLVVDSRLMDQASLVNYPRDVARATMAPELVYVDAARFRPVPVDRTLDAEEVVRRGRPADDRGAPRPPARRGPADTRDALRGALRPGRQRDDARAPGGPRRRSARPSARGRSAARCRAAVGEPATAAAPPEPVPTPEPEPEPEG